MQNMLMTWIKKPKNIGKAILMLGGFLYPLVLIIYMIANKSDFVLKEITNFKYDQAFIMSIILLLMVWFTYILVPISVNDHKWSIVWATILLLFAITFAAIYLYKPDFKSVILWFLLIFIAHLVVGSAWWLISLIRENSGSVTA